MVQPVVLRPEELVPDRPFTNPATMMNDVTTLRFMVDQLCLYLEDPQRFADLPRPIVVHQPGRHDWLYRLIIARPEHLRQPGECTFVGFLGDRRPEVDVSMADEFDQMLVAEIPSFPRLLSYCSLALVSGNFSNLVIFADPEAKGHWSRSMAHAQAAQTLAPKYYRSVKLYNGQLPDGIQDSQALQLTRVKYYEYGAAVPWHAVRELQTGRAA